jgi:LSD1 subclass zinc finger protein
MSESTDRCGVCRSVVDEEDLFCANCGTESPRGTQVPAKPDSSRLAKDNFVCSGCGASMSYDASAKALRCPFCGSVDMVSKPDAQLLAPKWVIPFRLTREEAEQRMRKWLRRGLFRPGGLSESARVAKMTEVYVPYWVFQAKTHTYWTADTNQTPPGARAQWYPLTGEHEGSYSGLLIGASGAISPRETAAICPFDLSEGVPPDKVDLDNVIFEQFSLPRKYARPLAQQGLEAAEAEACAACVPGRSRNVHVNVLVSEMSSEPVLLPVWIMAYTFRDKVYRFLVNGQTGRATGEAPVSLAKIAGAVLAAIAIVAAILLLLGLLRM